MKTTFSILILCFCINFSSLAQKKRTISALISFQGDRTIYDRFKYDNKGGPGLGLQINYNTNSIFDSILELNLDAIGNFEKIYYTTDNGDEYSRSKKAISSIFIGPSFKINDRFFSSITFGSSFFNEKAHFGIRPSIGFFLSKRKIWSIKSSYTNAFINDTLTDKDLGYLSLGISLKLF